MLMNRKIIVKFRLPKFYRNKYIDSRIRSQRTILEGRSLINLIKIGIPVPNVYKVQPSKGCIFMKFIEGQLVKNVVTSLDDLQLKEIF